MTVETIVDLERRLGLVYREVTLSTGSVIGIAETAPEQGEAIRHWLADHDAAADSPIEELSNHVSA